MEGRPGGSDQPVCESRWEVFALSWAGYQDVEPGHQGALQGRSGAYWSLKPHYFVIIQSTWLLCGQQIGCNESCWNFPVGMNKVAHLLVLQRFTGHSTAVTTLCFATARPSYSNGLYFLSGAAHDRLLSVWWVAARFKDRPSLRIPLWQWPNVCCAFCYRQVREDGKDKNSVVSFTLTDEPRHIDLVTSSSKEEVRGFRIFFGFLTNMLSAWINVIV